MTKRKGMGVRKSRKSNDSSKSILISEVTIGGKPITPKKQEKLRQRIFEVLTQTA